VQIVPPHVADAGVELPDFGFRFFPVAAEFLFPAHRPLITGKPLLMLSETGQRFMKRTIRERGEAGNAHVHADRAVRFGHGRGHRGTGDGRR
jgi:hypothetical protein